MLSRHRPKKAFGQNFLIDPIDINKIITAINSQASDVILEIGPGLGALTTGIVNNCHKLFAVEIDNNLAAKLREDFSQEISQNKLVVINQDVLQLDLLQLFSNYNNSAHNSVIRVIGNLPYNISTPLLFKVLQSKVAIKDLHFLLQQEVAERLIAIPGNKVYGRLSVMAQYHAQINILFDIDPEAFKPIPKVNSSLVKFIPYTIAQLPIQANNYQHFYDLVTTAFSKRRKIIANSLKIYGSEIDWHQLNIDPKLRPESLTVKDFVKISNYLVTIN
jgi:16S rRNA (adenine1518-N6/adenine1519-N6)-dimethyltransferase